MGRRGYQRDGSLVDPLARATRALGRASLDTRSWGSTRLPQKKDRLRPEGGERSGRDRSLRDLSRWQDKAAWREVYLDAKGGGKCVCSLSFCLL